MTTITDTITYADGRLANGQVVVSWPPFDLDGATVAGGQQAWPIVNGALSVTLYANINARPVGMFYTAVYELDEGALYKETWIVPDLPTVTLGQIRVAFPVAPSALINAQQLTSAGAQTGQFLGWNGAHWVPMFASSLNINPNTIGLGLGATGGDLNVSGSPAPLGGALVLNVPDAGPAARGVVSTGAQTIAGAKTFSSLAAFSAGVTITGASTIAGYTPSTRLISTGYGLTGGGSLAADRTIAVLDNSSVQKIRVLQTTTLKGTRQSVNFVAGANVTLTIADNAGNDWVDVTIASTGGGGGGATLPSGTATGDLLVWQAVPGPGFWTTLPKGTTGQVLTAGASNVIWSPVLAAGASVGDLLQWDGATWSALARGTSGQVLTAGASSVSWAAIPLQAQSPWRSNIDAAGYTLTGAGWIGVGVTTALTPVQVHTGANQNLGIQYDATLSAIGLRAYNDANSALIPMGFSASQFQLTGGNVGIGSVPALVATPAAILDVRSSASTALMVGIARQGGVDGARMNGTNAAPTALASGDLIAEFAARGYNGSALSTPRGGLEIWAGEAWTATANGTYLVLSTTPLGQTAPIERVRVTPLGSVGIANNLATLPFTGAEQITLTGGTAAATPGRLAIAGNITPTGLTAQLIFCNYAIPAAEKRLAAIHAIATPTVDSGALAFLTYTAGAENERMRIATDGKVGINQPTPAFQLDITGDLNITGTYRVGGTPFSVTAAQTPWQQDIDGNTKVLANASQIGVGVTKANLHANLQVTGQATSTLYAMLVTTQTFTWNTAGSSVRIGFGAASGDTYSEIDAQITGGTASGVLVLNGPGGAVTVGITTPAAAAQFHVAGPGAIFHDRAGGPAHLLCRSANGTMASPSSVGSGAQIGRFSFTAYDGAWVTTGLTGLQCYTTEAWSPGHHGALLSFYTTANGALDSVERMRIGQDGKVGINQISPAYQLDVAGDINISTGSQYRVNGVALTGGVTTVAHPTRTLGTVYRNTGTSVLWVSVSVYFSVNNTLSSATCYSDATTSPTTVATGFWTNSLLIAAVQPMTFAVLPGHYYSVAAVPASAVVQTWTEWQ